MTFELFKVRDLILLVDVSQQAAQHWPAMRQWVHDQLRDLRPGERFVLVGFNHDLQGYKQGIFCPVEEATEAMRWLLGVQPAGQASLDVLLERLLSMVPERGRQLLVRAAVAGPVTVTVPLEGVQWPFVLEVESFGQGMGALESVADMSRRAHGLG